MVNIWNAFFFTEFFYDRGDLGVMYMTHAWEQMVLYLVIDSSEKTSPYGRAIQEIARVHDLHLCPIILFGRILNPVILFGRILNPVILFGRILSQVYIGSAIMVFDRAFECIMVKKHID
jgi:hypothetical protein